MKTNFILSILINRKSFLRFQRLVISFIVLEKGKSENLLLKKNNGISDSVLYDATVADCKELPFDFEDDSSFHVFDGEVTTRQCKINRVRCQELGAYCHTGSAKGLYVRAGSTNESSSMDSLASRTDTISTTSLGHAHLILNCFCTRARHHKRLRSSENVGARTMD